MESEKMGEILRMLEKTLHDMGYSVLSHKDGNARVINVDDAKTRERLEVRIAPRE